MTECNLTETNEKFISYKKGMTAWFGIWITVAKVQWTTLLWSDYNLINRIAMTMQAKLIEGDLRGMYNS